MGVFGKRLPPAALPWEREQVPILREAGWALGLYWRDSENVTPTGIWSLDHPTRGESLMSYPGSLKIYMVNLHEDVNGLVHLVHERSTDSI